MATVLKGSNLSRTRLHLEEKFRAPFLSLGLYLRWSQFLRLLLGWDSEGRVPRLLVGGLKRLLLYRAALPVLSPNREEQGRQDNSYENDKHSLHGNRLLASRGLYHIMLQKV